MALLFDETSFRGLWDLTTDQSNGLLRSALLQAKDAVCITDAELESPGPRILFINEAFTELTGYTANEVLGKTPRILQGPLTDRNVLKRLKETLLRGEKFEGEAVNYRKDGTFFDLQWQIAPVRNAFGDTTHFISFQRDVSEGRRTRDQLAETEERYRVLVEKLPDPLFVHTDGKLVFVNEAALELLALDRRFPERILDLSALDFVHPECRPAFVARCDALSHGHATGLVECKLVRADRTVIPVESVSVSLTYNGKPSILVIVRDLTEKKRLEEQFLQSQRHDCIGLLAAGIAHDLTRVFTPILIAAPFLLQRTQDAEHRRILENIEGCALRGAERIQLLAKLAAESNGEAQTVAIVPILHDVVDLIHDTFPHNISVDLSATSDLPRIKATPLRLYQAILNLCLNARDAMPDGGVISLQASIRELNSEEARWARAPAASRGLWMVIEVKDTGRGIPANLRTKIWDPFFTTKPMRDGSGLGLTTARGIVAQHGGFMDMASRVGEGATFRIFLPTVSEGNPASSGRMTPNELRGQGESILVLDDATSTVVVVSAILAKNGYHVITANTGADALKQLAQTSPEVRAIVTNLDMPENADPALRAALREAQPGVKLLVLSGLNDTVSEGERSLIKPFTVRELLASLRELLHDQITPAPSLQR